MVEYIRSDLEAILFHIKIAEANAAGQPLYGPGGLIPTYNLSWGLRTVDGSYNNLLPGREHWGASDQPFLTHVDPTYRTVMVDPDGAGPSGPVPMSYAPTTVDPDGAGRAVAGDVQDPMLRTISNLIVDQTLTNPAATMESMRRDGIEGDLLAIAATVKAAYEPLKPKFKAVDDATDAYSEAKAANAVNPTPANQTAENNALAAKQAAEADLAEARANDADGTGPGLSFDALLATYGIELEGANVVLPAVATDEGLSAPFNSWFTLFGQFFDHGLDLVNKGGSGTVFIPLAKDDPLYDAGPDGIAGNADDPRTNFMVLTRATTTPGADGVFGTADDVRPLNTTSPFVDQNQTYSSHPSHQVFLREYVMTATGPVATGHLIEGANGGMANWGELKRYTRDMLGIELKDTDVGSVPLLRTDAYGKFIPGANGFPQVITGLGADGIPNTADDIVIEGNPTANGGLGVSLVSAIRTTSAFLADIAHNAAPKGLADGDLTIGLDNLGGSTTGVYDNELLDRHFIAGDGRVNENIGLTAVHAVFHAEHNRMVDHSKSVVLADAQAMLAGGATEADAVLFLNEWLRVDVTTVPTSMAGLVWDGERLFQAAKFGTEMQYQHLVFEEFARKIQPSITAFIVPDGYDAEINPAIMAEFAHVVYRFGHSMLTETVDRYDANFTPDHISLIEAFLNPVEFNGVNGTVMDGIAIGDIVRGMTRQVGNQIDEFVTTALRDNLLGLPLDLATINLARGRDTGAPSLNAARRDFYEATSGNPALKPYASWTDFAANLKNEASIINFVAAYGTHSLITSQTTTEGRRDAALTIITGVSVGGKAIQADAEDFLNATGAYAGGDLGGLEHVDLWIGGLAERTMPFGGMLGSTFNFVFEVQLESLQNGDRFYYLQRNTGQHLFEQLEANSLASMIMRHSDATHLPADVFSTPAFTLEVDPTKQFNDLDGDGTLENGDPQSTSLTAKLVIRNDPATSEVDTNYLRYTGADHVVLGGTAGNDTLIAGIGDDTVHGDAGDDRIEGNFGNDELRGGDGDDIITDMGGDDTLKGGKGNDALNGGSGIDLILAGDGNDFVVLGTDGDGGAFGGQGNDFLLNNLTSLPAVGNEGDDWIEDGANAGQFGDNNDDGFFRDSIRGNDVMIGVGGGFDEYRAEGGDDIMVGSLGSAKHAGMSGFDWVTYKNLTKGQDASLLDGFLFDEAPIDPANITLQRFESVEGLSGSRFDDRLTGSNFTVLDRIAGSADGGFRGSVLDAQGIALIAGLQEVLGAGVTSYSAGDIILGGDGNDLIIGGGGNDIIDGDKWLNVRISVRANKDGTGAEIATANSMTELTTRIFNGTFNPGQLVIVREILPDATNVTGASMNIDTAGFSGLLAEYDIEGRTVNGAGLQLTRASDVNGDGVITVSHARGSTLDGTDLVKNIEELRFADQTLVIGGPNLGRPVLDLHAFDVVSTVVAQYLDDFRVQSFSNSFGATSWNSSWVESNDGANLIGDGQIQINVNDSQGMRFIAGDGASITRAVDLSAPGATTLSYSFSYANLDVGDSLRVEFAANGTDFVTLHFIASLAPDDFNFFNTYNMPVNGTANSALRFTVSALDAGEVIKVDNISFVTLNTKEYLDNFDVQSFTNSVGDTVWDTTWVEAGDGANLIDDGQIQIDVNDSNGMRFIAGDGASITRDVDLSGLGVSTLSYRYNFAGLDTGDTLTVEFASDGDNFVTVQTIAGATATDAFLQAQMASIAVSGTANSAIRFTVSALGAGESIRVDDVRFVGGSTVQVPAIDGTGFTSTFTEDGAAAAIALNSAVTNTEGSPVVSAQIRLTNAQALDVLSIAGALPAGITSSFGPPVAGQITLNLSGSASPAAYQTAIEAVRFSNTSQNPNVTPRNISVTVTDSDNVSLAAIATVSVVAVNDAPVTVADAIVTNIASGNIVVPEWALLANDTDVDSTVLDITDVSAAVGVTGLSLTTTPGSVTFADDSVAGGSFTYTASDGGVGGTTNGAVTMTNVSPTNVADNFNGPNTATPSAANNSTGATAWTTSWIEANDDANIRTGQIQIDAGASPGTNALRFGIGDGGSISRVVNLAGVTSATLSLSFDKTGIDANESVQVQFAADGINFVTLSTITSGGGNGGVNANGTLNLALTGALSANSAIRFVGSAINGLTNGVADTTENLLIDDVLISYGAPNAAITGGAGNQILVGNEAGTSFTGGAGNDTVLANGGDDVINWSVGHGRDFVDGGANGAVGDRFIVNGDGTVENFVVYARAEAIAAGVVVQNAATEIVITRNGIANVVAELDNIEEITINTGDGADTVTGVGDFGPTSLFFNTITVNGQGGRDTIDASQLTSAHKLVLNQGAAAAQGAPFVEFEGIGRAAMEMLTRKGVVDMFDPADFFAASRKLNGYHNPMFERTLALDEALYDLGHALQQQNSALQFDSADYLIN